MKRPLIRFLLLLLVAAGVGGVRQASAQSVYGYSALYLTSGLVYSYSMTDLEYGAQAYYSVQTDAYLWTGNSYSSASTTVNDGYVSLNTSPAINTVTPSRLITG